MSKILYLDEARQHTLSAGPKHLLRLIPGRNVVEDDVFDAVLNTVGSKEKGKDKNGQSMLQTMIDNGTIKVVGESVDISKMKVPEALDLIELEASEEGLLDLHEQENTNSKPRKSILEAIDSKMESIEKANQVKEKVTDEG